MASAAPNKISISRASWCPLVPIVALIASLTACGEPAGSLDLGPSLHDAAAAGDGALAGDGLSLPPDLALAPVRFHVRFDYRFDDAGFFTPARRATLESAAAIWGRIITDDFAAIPAGTPLKTRDPEQPSQPALSVTSSEPIDDLLVFVATAAHAGTTLASARGIKGVSEIPDTGYAQELADRFDGADHQPWTAWISFDPDHAWFFDATPEEDSDLPADQIDFLSVALHELGHCLGIGAAPAWTAQVGGAAFSGPQAIAEHGAPVPLTVDGQHVAPGTTSGGVPVLMDVSDGAGERHLPTALDRALLRDLGYKLAP